jgi:hypothetical protein
MHYAWQAGLPAMPLQWCERNSSIDLYNVVSTKQIHCAWQSGVGRSMLDVHLFTSHPLLYQYFLQATILKTPLFQYFLEVFSIIAKMYGQPNP